MTFLFFINKICYIYYCNLQYTVRNQLLPQNSKGREESSWSHLLIRIMHQTAYIKNCLCDIEKRHRPQKMTLFSDIPQWDTFFILARRVWLNLLSSHWDERKGLLTVWMRTLSKAPRLQASMAQVTQFPLTNDWSRHHREMTLSTKLLHLDQSWQLLTQPWEHQDTLFTPWFILFWNLISH